MQFNTRRTLLLSILLCLLVGAGAGSAVTVGRGTAAISAILAPSDDATPQIVVDGADLVSQLDVLGSADLNLAAGSVTPRMVAEYGDMVSRVDLRGSADLDNVAGTVLPRIAAEYGDTISRLDLQGSAGLNTVAGTASPRTAVEYADFIYRLSLQSSEGLRQATGSVTPRVIVQYAESVFGTMLERPLFLVSPNSPPAQPTNSSPENARNDVTLTPTLQSSAFSDSDGDTHAASEWQVRTSTGSYSSPVYEDTTSAPDLTSTNVPLGKLTYSTTYYWHVRYQDNRGAWSEWSAETSFTTASSPSPGDTTPPTAIGDLAAAAVTASSVTLSWTAPGDDGGTGTASTYDIRYSTTAITDANWGSASQCSSEPAAKAAGSSQTFACTGLSPDTTYYFAIKVADEVPNWSGLSNVISKKTEMTSPSPSVYWLAKAIMSEASVGTYEERVAVGWTVLNRLDDGGFGSDIESVAKGGYAWNQEPTTDIMALANDLVGRKISDTTRGATHFFSPRSMPKEGEPTQGFDVGGGLHEVPGITGRVYFPSWTNTLSWVGDLANVRQAYFMFYSPNQQPTIPTALNQFKSDGVSGIMIGGGTIERSIVFKATVADPDGDQVKLQVELRRLDEYGGAFDQTKGGLKESGLVNSGSVAVVYASELNDADYHWRARTVDEYGACGQWMDFGNNLISTLDFKVCAALGETIERRLQQQVAYPPNLLNAQSFTEAVTAVWTDFTSWITQTNLKDMYYDFYLAGINYDTMRFNALIEARRAVKNGDVDRALVYLHKSETYERLSNMSFEAANDVFLGNLDAAETLAQGIKDGCQAAVQFGLTFVSPEAAKFADVFYDAVDFGLDSYLSGGGEAVKNLIIQHAIEAVFNEVPFDQLGGKTLSDWMANRTGKLMFPELSKLVASQEFQWAISKVVKEAVPTVSESIVTDVMKAVVDKAEGMVSTLQVKLHSPGELRVYNSSGQVVGLVNGAIQCQIPQSMYCDETVIIFCPQDTYHYEVVGTGEGTYGLEVTWVLGGTTSTFNATDIPIALGAVHHYAVDWSALSQGEQGATLDIDSDGDGAIDTSLAADAELTHEEFLSATAKEEGLPSWIWIAVGAGAVAVVVGVVLMGRRLSRKPAVSK